MEEGYKKIPEMPQPKPTGEFKEEIVKKEIEELFTKILPRLESGTYLVNRSDLKFGEEIFGNDQAGDGVRKETFVNVRSSKRKLHLAEIRSGWTIRRYLEEVARQRAGRKK